MDGGRGGGSLTLTTTIMQGECITHLLVLLSLAVKINFFLFVYFCVKIFISTNKKLIS